MATRLALIGASVCGPAHAEEGVASQDAWRGEAHAFGGWAAVADGLGSCPLGGHGAEAAVQACRWAWMHWSRRRGASAGDFVRLVEALWRVELDGAEPRAACTTVVFAGVTPTGRLLCAQLGDGLLGISIGGTFERITPARASFGNVTDALGASRDGWVTALRPSLPAGAALLLATDGVSDDLRPGAEGALVDWIAGELLPASDGPTRLAQSLVSWPVPRHRDDKTVVVLCNR